MKNILYTCSTGDYDNIIEPVDKRGWTYKVITNGDSSLDFQRQARQIKLCPHLFFEYDQCIWFDANLRFGQEIFDQDHQFVTMQHPFRNCAYDEIKACMKYRKAPSDILKRQIYHYAENGLPVETGMISSGLIFRKNTEAVRSFGEKWFQEILRWTARDQISFSYLAWKHRFDYKTIPYCVEVMTRHKRKAYDGS